MSFFLLLDCRSDAPMILIDTARDSYQDESICNQSLVFSAIISKAIWPMTILFLVTILHVCIS